jgi:DnaK suppressor protein
MPVKTKKVVKSKKSSAPKTKMTKKPAAKAIKKAVKTSRSKTNVKTKVTKLKKASKTTRPVKKSPKIALKKAKVTKSVIIKTKKSSATTKATKAKKASPTVKKTNLKVAKKAAIKSSTTTKAKVTKPVVTKSKAVTTVKKPVVKTIQPTAKAIKPARIDIPGAGFLGIPAYPIHPNEEYMNDHQKDHFRKLLERWKVTLMEEVDRTMHHMKDEAANYPDMSDRASQEEEFNLELRARDRERKLIWKIDEALERIEQDNYGYCDACGVEIGIRRLEARPTATLCIDCKTLDEFREKQTRA